MDLARSIAVALAAFGVGVGLAELFGASSLGVAFGVGQICFAFTVAALIMLDKSHSRG